MSCSVKFQKIREHRTHYKPFFLNIAVFIASIALDYQNADAIGILAQDNKEDSYFKAGLIINDKDLSGKPGHNINRINLVTENGNAALIMKDANEVPRIILKVDSLG